MKTIATHEACSEEQMPARLKELFYDFYRKIDEKLKAGENIHMLQLSVVMNSAALEHGVAEHGVVYKRTGGCPSCVLGDSKNTVRGLLEAMMLTQANTNEQSS